MEFFNGDGASSAYELSTTHPAIANAGHDVKQGNELMPTGMFKLTYEDSTASTSTGLTSPGSPEESTDFEVQAPPSGTFGNSVAERLEAMETIFQGVQVVKYALHDTSTDSGARVGDITDTGDLGSVGGAEWIITFEGNAS